MQKMNEMKKPFTILLPAKEQSVLQTEDCKFFKGTSMLMKCTPLSAL